MLQYKCASRVYVESQWFLCICNHQVEGSCYYVEVREILCISLASEVASLNVNVGYIKHLFKI